MCRDILKLVLTDGTNLIRQATVLCNKFSWFSYNFRY